MISFCLPSSQYRSFINFDWIHGKRIVTSCSVSFCVFLSSLPHDVPSFAIDTFQHEIYRMCVIVVVVVVVCRSSVFVSLRFSQFQCAPTDSRLFILFRRFHLRILFASQHFFFDIIINIVYTLRRWKSCFFFRFESNFCFVVVDFFFLL